MTLRALSEQELGQEFEVVIADDGSGDSVAAVVDDWKSRLPIRHVWQPDEGFRKARVLNCGALAAAGDYLIFLDADCVPLRGFLNGIRAAARPNWFLTTKRVDLSEAFTARVLGERLPVWRWSALKWLSRAPREIGRPGYLLPGRDRRRPWRPDLARLRPPVRCLLPLRSHARALRRRERVRRALHTFRRRRGSGSGHQATTERIALRLARPGRNGAAPLAPRSKRQDAGRRAVVSRDGAEQSRRSAGRPARARGRVTSVEREPRRRRPARRSTR